MTRNLLATGVLGALGMLAGCSSGGDDGGTGTLKLAIMDAPVYDATQVWVTFTGVSLKPQGSGPAIEIAFPAPVKLDLLSLNADNAETLLSGYSVPAGKYNWLELHVDAVDLTRSAMLSVWLFKDGKSQWRQGTDSGGEIDVAVVEIDRAAVPAAAEFRCFTPAHLQVELSQVEVGTGLLVVGFPLGFHDTM